MAYKDIVAPVFSLAADQAALVAAGEVANLFNTRATALIVAVHLASSFSDEAHTLTEVMADIAAGTRSAAGRERAKIIDWLEHAPHDFDVRDVQVEGAINQGEAEAHTRVADLVIMARGSVHQRARRAFLERVLFGAGRPMLLVPEAPVMERAWERFIVGWNASAEAMRAVSATLPLLMQAKEVVVATVDAKPSQAGHAEAPGHELAQHLARHGVKTEVRNLDGRGRSVEAALIEEAVALSADALVIGAYGHSRAREFLFGGVTRALLAHAQLPLLLSH